MAEREMLRLGVDERLLRELPRMFESFQDAVAELIQNAHRAGARRVDITVDHDRREVEVRDDGPGAPDPEPLLRAGLSGWGERVVEPAGLGLFALLGLAEHVVIESRCAGGKGWRVEITPAAFDGAEVPKEPIRAAGQPTGLTIRARLGERADLWLQTQAVDGVTFRHLFPVHVTLTEIRGGERE
ncbi:MAG TPA: ATP-binding protein, partial [Thermaerobacter sp.]